MRRRTSIAVATLAASTVALGAGVPLAVHGGPSPAGAAAPAAATRTTTPIKHVVVLFDENVSFDHYFGTYPQAANTEGPRFTAQGGTPGVNGLRSSSLNGDHDLLTQNPNSSQPRRLTPAQAVTCDQDHSYGNEQKAYDGGKVDRFPESVGKGSCATTKGADQTRGPGLVMDYFDGNTVGGLWNYAQHYAMSDDSYGTGYGPSTPGALNLVSGQTKGALNADGQAAPDSSGVVSGSVIADPDPIDDCSTQARANQIGMSGTNVGDLLNAKGVTWGWFQGGFRPTVAASQASGGAPATPAVCGAQHANVGGGVSSDYSPHHEPFQYYASTANPHHLPPSSVSAIGTTDQANHQYDLTDFHAAVAAGKLPGVSFLKAPEYQDGHAGYSDPTDEQHFLVDEINRIQSSPDWASTAIVVAYDDSDGWYDHVQPPTGRGSTTTSDALDGASKCHADVASGTTQGQCGFGPRLPLLVISPYARQNAVDHARSDQSSVLKFVEDNWSLGRIGNGSADADAGTLDGLFDLRAGAPRAPKLLLNPDGTPKAAPGAPGGHGGTPAPGHGGPTAPGGGPTAPGGSAPTGPTAGPTPPKHHRASRATVRSVLRTLDRHGRLAVRVRCGSSDGCRVVVHARRAGHVVAHRTVTLGAGRSTTVRLRLDARTRRMITRRGRVAVRVDASGLGRPVQVRAHRSA